MSYNVTQSAAQSLTLPKGSKAPWGPNDAPLFIVLGQSNAYGHATTLAAGDQKTVGYTNVFTLDRTASTNALYATNVTTASIAWTGLTTLGKHNVGTNSASLGAQDHTCNATNQLAKLWQAHITAGNTMGLPNLYVINMSWGSQGIDPSLSASGVDRWNPARSTTDVESLYPRAIRTLSAAVESLRALGKNPRIIAVQWNQWESEAGFNDTAASNATMNFLRIKAGINDALGTQETPWRFFWPMSTTYTAPRVLKVQQAITAVVNSDPVNISLIDTRLAPNYTGVSPAFGIFGGDNVHYNLATQQWFAQKEWDNILAGFKGVTVPVIQNRVPAFLQSTASAVTVVNDLVTGGTTSALSAEQGKVLAAISPKTLNWRADQYAAGVVANSTSNQLASLTFASTTGYVYQVNDTVEPLTGKKVFTPSAISGTGTNGGQVLLVASATPSDGKFGYFEWDNVGHPQVSICLAVKPRTAVNTYNTLGYGYIALWLSTAWSGSQAFPTIGVTATGTSHDTGTPFAMIWDLANMGTGNTGIRTIPFVGTPVAGVYSGTPAVSTTLTNQAKALVTGWPMTSLVRWRAGLLPANSGTLTVEWYDTTTSTWKVAIRQQNMNTVRTVGNNFDSGQLGFLFGMSSTANNSVVNMNAALSSARMTNITFVSQD
jgi:hypothetical protein